MIVDLSEGQMDVAIIKLHLPPFNEELCYNIMIIGKCSSLKAKLHIFRVFPYLMLVCELSH